MDSSIYTTASSPTKTTRKKRGSGGGQLELSDRIRRLPCQAIHTPTIMVVKVINQLIHSNRLHIVGPPQSGNFDNITTENITAYGPMFKSPVGA